nr:MAG TPA: LAMBDA REPRESSOR (TRIPLE MUTANT)/DNA COMPLEX-DNA COMPLEX, DOUBLE HELIX, TRANSCRIPTION-DNA.1A [Caudoviricetes sp.]
MIFSGNFRFFLDLTQEKAARQLGISPDTLEQFLRAKKLVKKSKKNLQLVKKASNIFGVRKLTETTKEVKLKW